MTSENDQSPHTQTIQELCLNGPDKDFTGKFTHFQATKLNMIKLQHLHVKHDKEIIYYLHFSNHDNGV